KLAFENGKGEVQLGDTIRRRLVEVLEPGGPERVLARRACGDVAAEVRLAAQSVEHRACSDEARQDVGGVGLGRDHVSTPRDRAGRRQGQGRRTASTRSPT